MLTVVTGPPCAGKTTYMRQHALPGDITIDFGTIVQALGAQVPHGHAGHIWHITLAARNAAITQAIQQRQQYDANGARVITLTADRAELHRRAGAERPPDWHARIDQWLDTGGKPSVQHDPASRSRTRW